MSNKKRSKIQINATNKNKTFFQRTAQGKRSVRLLYKRLYGVGRATVTCRNICLKYRVCNGRI